MKFIAIISFILGCITYFIFPRDWQVPNVPTPPQDTAIVILNENGCITYQYPYEVDKNLQIAEKVVCK